jgi:hypothetical protein
MGIGKVKAHYVEELALAQLETALTIYLDGGDRGSVLTLASTADEIFGNRLKSLGRESSLESHIRAVLEIHRHLYGDNTDIDAKVAGARANYARNRLKHWNPGDPEILTLDLETEAVNMVNRAIDNYWLLKQGLTEQMIRFERGQRGRE